MPKANKYRAVSDPTVHVQMVPAPTHNHRLTRIFQGACLHCAPQTSITKTFVFSSASTGGVLQVETNSCYLNTEIAWQSLDSALERPYGVATQLVRVLLHLVRQADLHPVRQMVDLKATAPTKSSQQHVVS